MKVKKFSRTSRDFNRDHAPLRSAFSRGYTTPKDLAPPLI